jgi:hypothetical protein
MRQDHGAQPDLHAIPERYKPTNHTVRRKLTILPNMRVMAHMGTSHQQRARPDQRFPLTPSLHPRELAHNTISTNHSRKPRLTITPLPRQPNRSTPTNIRTRRDLKKGFVYVTNRKGRFCAHPYTFRQGTLFTPGHHPPTG